MSFIRKTFVLCFTGATLLSVTPALAADSKDDDGVIATGGACNAGGAGSLALYGLSTIGIVLHRRYRSQR